MSSRVEEVIQMEGEGGMSSAPSENDFLTMQHQSKRNSATSDALQGPILHKTSMKRKTRAALQRALTTKEGWINTLHTIFPFTEWIPEYKFADYIIGDVNAGLTVGVMLVPQAMAYAQLAGLPFVYGLYASLLPIFIYATMGTSKQLAVGPVSVLSLLVSTTCSQIVNPTVDPYRYAQLCAGLALLAGSVNAFLGIFRLGFIVKLMSPALITGFMSASSIIISCSQLAGLFGLSTPKTDYFWLNIYYVAAALPQSAWLSCVFSITFFFLVFYLQRWKPLVPWALLLIIVDTVISYLVKTYTTVNLPVVGTVPQGLPSASVPDLSSEDWLALVPSAFIVAFVGFAESISIAKKYAQEDRYQLNPSQELMALGLSNVVGSFFSAYPVTGSFSRTAVLYSTGSKSQISGIIVGIVVICALLFLTPLFYFIPKAVLSSVVLVAVVKLFEWHRFFSFWKINKIDFFVAFVTLAVCLGAGADIGIGTGLCASLMALIYESSRPHTAQLGDIGGKLAPNYRNVKRNAKHKLVDHVVIARVDGGLSFPNATYVQDKFMKYLEKTDAKKPVRIFILECATISTIDYGGIEAMRNFADDLKARHVLLILVGVRGEVADVLRRAEFDKLIGARNFFHTVAEAVEESKELMPILIAEEERRKAEAGKNEAPAKLPPLRRLIAYCTNLFHRLKGTNPQQNGQHQSSTPQQQQQQLPEIQLNGQNGQNGQNGLHSQSNNNSEEGVTV